VSLPFQDKLVGSQHRTVVVHYQDPICACHAHNFITGKSILKTVPLPGLLRTESLPAWFWIIPLTIHNPNPVPFSPFVVTKGSKIVRIISGGIPDPLSAMRIRIQPCKSSAPGR